MLGIDLGSRSVKIVQMEQDKLIKTAIFDTISFYRQYRNIQKGKLSIDFSALGFKLMFHLNGVGA